MAKFWNFMFDFLYKKLEIAFSSYFEEYKNHLMGITTRLWLSIRIWRKFQTKTVLFLDL